MRTNADMADRIISTCRIEFEPDVDEVFAAIISELEKKDAYVEGYRAAALEYIKDLHSIILDKPKL